MSRVSRREAEARRVQAVATQPVAQLAAGPELVATGEALRRGAITGEHVREICAVFAHCPDWVSVQRRASDERTLLDAAMQAAPETVRKVGRRLRAYWDQDGPKPDDEKRADPRREFRFRYGFDGRIRFTGEFDAETGSVLPPPWLVADRQPVRNTAHDPPGRSARTVTRNDRHGGDVKDGGTHTSSFEFRTAARSCARGTSTQSPLPMPL